MHIYLMRYILNTILLDFLKKNIPNEAKLNFFKIFLFTTASKKGVMLDYLDPLLHSGGYNRVSLLLQLSTKSLVLK